ncbi:hypothetical protein C4J95_1788 [Pseudomonas orientalis]|nr:hypothetical protein C4J96_1734 [Pseudomonas orientalis]AZE99264.1 hypothetical protein C4J95_1788 [Pseudomonas orientalis]
MRKYHTTESEFRGGFPMDEGNTAGPYGDRLVWRTASFWDTGA